MRLVDYTEEQRALGGTATIGITAGEGVNAAALFTGLWRRTFVFEKRFSRFLPDSELTAFNERAGLKTQVSEEFMAILTAAKQLAERTDGLFNPFVLPALQRAGYINSAVEAYADDISPDYSNRSVTQPDRLELGDGWARIPYGTAIDLGGCGKGYLADQLGTYLREHEVTGYWINLSGDIATYGHRADGSAFTIAVQAAFSEEADAYLVTCPPEPAGIATSGTLPRTTQTGKLTGHHLIDPRSGHAAETDIVLATLVAPSALEADVLASCAVMLGSASAPAFLRAQHMAAWHVQYRGTDGTPHHTTHGSAISTYSPEVTHA